MRGLFERIRSRRRRHAVNEPPRVSVSPTTPQVAGPEKVRSDPIAYGIDFGTSNSQIAAALADRVEVVTVESGALGSNLPSIVYLHRDANRAAGTDGVRQYLLTAMDDTPCRNCDLVHTFRGRAETDCRQFRQGGACQDARLIAGVKSELADRSFTETHSWAVDFTPAELVAVILSRLKREADRHYGANVRRVVLGHPVVFAGAEATTAVAQKCAEERLVEAARLAGFEEIELFPEPSAALEDEAFEQGIILAADFGGGTFDAAVIKAPRLPGEVVGKAGEAIGGESFDQALFEAKVAPELGLRSEYVDRSGNRRPFPARFRARLRSLRGVRQLLSDRDFGPMLREFKNYDGGQGLAVLEEILYGGFAYDFYRAIEDAKVDLSTSQKAAIRLERGRTIDLHIPVTREEFEDLAVPLIRPVSRTIDAALEQGGIGTQDVDVVVRTGGSSLIPAFQRLLEDMFGAEKVQARGPFTAVAVGLARRAQALWA